MDVATVHETQSRVSLMSQAMNPVWPCPNTAGLAVIVLVAMGINWTVHVGIELLEPGDVLVVAQFSPSSAGNFGDLLVKFVEVRGMASEYGLRLQIVSILIG